MLLADKSLDKTKCTLIMGLEVVGRGLLQTATEETIGLVEDAGELAGRETLIELVLASSLAGIADTMLREDGALTAVRVLVQLEGTATPGLSVIVAGDNGQWNTADRVARAELMEPAGTLNTDVLGARRTNGRRGRRLSRSARSEGSSNGRRLLLSDSASLLGAAALDTAETAQFDGLATESVVKTASSVLEASMQEANRDLDSARSGGGKTPDGIVPFRLRLGAPVSDLVGASGGSGRNHNGA